MSSALDMADLIKTRLTTAPADGELATPLDITALEPVVYQQQDINSKLAAQVARAQGTAILIICEGYQNGDPDDSRPRLSVTYTIEVWSKPVISAGAYPAVDVMEAIILRLWRWSPTPAHMRNFAQVGNGGLVPDDKFLKYDLTVTIPISL